MYWIANSLNRKFIMGTASGLALSSLLFLLLYMQLYHSELTEERARTATQVNDLLQTSLENAMLKRDLPGLTHMVKKLGEQPGIVSVVITNPSGEIRFSSNPDLFGSKLAEPYREMTPTTLFIEIEQAREALRSINPVHNKQPCTECHGPIEQHPINGILYVDYDAAPLRNKVRNTTLLLMSAGALIVVLNLTGGWWFIRQHIIKPVDHLTRTSEYLTNGDLDARVNIAGSDEFARLGDSFNFMAANLQEKLQELAEQKAFLQALVDAIPDGVRIIDQEFQILLTNQAYRKQQRLRDETDVGQTCYGHTHGSEKPCPPTLLTCPVHEITNKDCSPIKVVHQHTRCDNSKLNVEIFAAPMRVFFKGKESIFVVESIRDLAEEVKFSHEQKLSDLGLLATGIAHEIHNPLASLKLVLDATEKSIAANKNCPESILEQLKLVDHKIESCIQLTDKMLKLGSPPSDYLELVDINLAVQETLSLLTWEAEQSGITICEIFDSSQPRVLASNSELRMVALNLAQNAFHAMPEGGELTVTSLQKDDRILIRFADTGAGIRSVDLPHIFNPFFSRRADTKRGTGLGLSISLAIVKKYGGTIHVESEFSSGSLFTIDLPDANIAIKTKA